MIEDLMERLDKINCILNKDTIYSYEEIEEMRSLSDTEEYLNENT